MEKRKAKMGMGPMFIVGIIFTILGIGFLPMGIVLYFGLKEETSVGFIFLCVFGGVGLLFLILGILFLVLEVRKRARCNELLNAGNYVMAEIMEISINYNVRVNDRYPYIVRCQYQDPNGNVHIFKSRNLYFNPETILKDRMVRVYVNGENYKYYYMDIDEVLPKVFEH